MDNLPPSRQNLESSNFQPVDPAFRPAGEPASAPPGPAYSPSPNNLPGPANLPVSNSIPSQNLPQAPASPAPSPAAPPPSSAAPIAPASQAIPPQTPVPSQAPINQASAVPPAGTAASPTPPANLPPASSNLNEFPEFEDPLADDSETKRVITIGGIIIAVLFITSGILYLVTKSKKSESPTNGENPPIEEPQNGEEPTEQPGENGGETGLPEDTATQKHLLLEESGNPLWEAEKYFSGVDQEHQAIELIFYDQNQENLSLADWVSQSELLIPEYVDDILTPNYHFYLVPDSLSENPKAALVLESVFSDHKKTENILSRWEDYLVQDLKDFILLGDEFDFVAGFENPNFQSSSKYSGARYFNFLKDGSVSLNYIVMRDKIVITNSFNSFESMVDLIMQDDNL